MGVSGCGKSTIGKALSETWSIPFFDGDDFHSQPNLDKMAGGHPLDDDDRRPWLVTIQTFAKDHLNRGSLIIACSALKASYRSLLTKDIEEVSVFIHLDGSFELIESRMKARNHFMPASLLQSQFDALEMPEGAIRVDIGQSINYIVQKINQRMLSEVGLVGLGVMGTSLSRNIAMNGFRMSLYNRRVEGKEEDIAYKTIRTYSELENAKGFEDLKTFVESIERPRKIILMITAGKAVDYLIDDIKDLLNEGDILLDGGNTFYEDTERRRRELAKHGIDWIGAGISGGEEGALKGPSIMPGGSEISVNRILPILQKIAAKDVNSDPCCINVGRGASGHFVKMVHNGIEYAEMQMIAEIYDLLRFHNGMSPAAIADQFEEWNQGQLSSYLLEISIDILRKEEGGELLLDQILDVASSKGTGSWTTSTAASLGVPVPTLTAALNARYISSNKGARVALSDRIQYVDSELVDVDKVKSAYNVSRMLNHIQGFDLIATASDDYHWEVDRSQLASIWMNGCIIRSKLMQDIAQIYSSENLFLSLASQINEQKSDLGNVVSIGADSSVAIPCLMASLSYLQSCSRAESASNMIQAQRDYFGAHTYKRKDDPTGPSHHTIWKLN